MVNVYDDLINTIPEFVSYDIFGREHHEEISPLGQLGLWLNKLAKTDAPGNQNLIERICSFLNFLYINRSCYSGDVRNDFCVYLFWTLDYQTINKIKNYLDSEILIDGREYLRQIDGNNYRTF